MDESLRKARGHGRVAYQSIGVIGNSRGRMEVLYGPDVGPFMGDLDSYLEH